MGGFALDGVVQGSRHPMGVDVALDEIVLGAALHGLARDFFIDGRAQDQNQSMRGGPEYLIEHLDSGAVRKHEVEQYDLDARSRKSIERIRQPGYAFDMERTLCSECLEDQNGYGGIVLDE
jgi:hypothetical protein